MTGSTSAVEMPRYGRPWKTLGSKEYGRESSPSRFPPPPTALGNRQKRDFHISTAPTSFVLFETKNPTARASGARRKQHPKGGFHSRRAMTPSGSSRIGMKVRFQAHLALESIVDFRLISGLENARPARRFSSATSPLPPRSAQPGCVPASRHQSPVAPHRQCRTLVGACDTPCDACGTEPEGRMARTLASCTRLDDI